MSKFVSVLLIFASLWVFFGSTLTDDTVGAHVLAFVAFFAGIYFFSLSLPKPKRQPKAKPATVPSNSGTVSIPVEEIVIFLSSRLVAVLQPFLWVISFILYCVLFPFQQALRFFLWVIPIARQAKNGISRSISPRLSGIASVINKYALHCFWLLISTFFILGSFAIGKKALDSRPDSFPRSRETINGIAENVGEILTTFTHWVSATIMWIQKVVWGNFAMWVIELIVSHITQIISFLVIFAATHLFYTVFKTLYGWKWNKAKIFSILANFAPVTINIISISVVSVVAITMLPPPTAKDHYKQGLGYELGIGVAQDYEAAAFWYIKSANQSYVPAIRNLAGLYMYGLGVLPSDNKAWQLFCGTKDNSESCGMMSANKAELLCFIANGTFSSNASVFQCQSKSETGGNAQAQFKIGKMYARGEDMPRDDNEAVAWFKRAAYQGHAEAQCDLAFMYNKGRGVTGDNITAHAWYNLSAAQDHAPSRKSLEALAATMNATDIAEAEKMAVELYENITRKWDEMTASN